ISIFLSFLRIIFYCIDELLKITFTRLWIGIAVDTAIFTHTIRNISARNGLIPVRALDCQLTLTRHRGNHSRNVHDVILGKYRIHIVNISFRMEVNADVKVFPLLASDKLYRIHMRILRISKAKFKICTRSANLSGTIVKKLYG